MSAVTDILEGTNADYNGTSEAVQSSVPSNFTAQKGYISRSIAMLGVATTKPFNQVQNNADFINCIRVGLPRKSLDSLMKISGLTTEEITGIIRTSDRTLRRYAPDQKLNAE